MKKVISAILMASLLFSLFGTVTVSAEQDAANPVLSTIGAQIRLPRHSQTGEFDLRFVTVFNPKALNLDNVKELGTLVVKEDDLGNGTLDMALYEAGDITVKKVKATFINVQYSDRYSFTCAIWGISPDKEKTVYVARAYAVLESGEIIYSEPVARGLYALAEVEMQKRFNDKSDLHFSPNDAAKTDWTESDFPELEGIITGVRVIVVTDNITSVWISMSWEKPLSEITEAVLALSRRKDGETEFYYDPDGHSW